MQPHVALMAVVPQRHCCCCRHWQLHVWALKKCRLDTHLALGSLMHWQDAGLKRNPQPHCCVAGHLHWQAVVSKV